MAENEDGRMGAEDMFDVDNPDDMEDFLNMLDNIDVSDQALAQKMEKEDTSQVEQQMENMAEDESSNLEIMDDLLQLTEDEKLEAAKKVDDMMSELGLVNKEKSEQPSQAGESAFVTPEDENILDLLDSDDGSVGELADVLKGLENGTVEPENFIPEETIEKKGFIQRIIEKFHKEPSEEELLQRKQEEEEERAWEKHQEEAARAKKAEADEKKKVKKAESEQKKQEKAEQKEAVKAAKQKEKDAKKAVKAEKAARKAAQKEAKRGPIPKSQLVPVKPILVFVILGIAFSVVFVIFSNYRFYNASIAVSKEQFIHQNYKKAYETLLGLEVKKKDERFYEQVRTVRSVDKDLDSYNSFVMAGEYEIALESLIRGVGKYNDQLEKAKELNLEQEMRGIYEEIIRELMVRFQMSAQEAQNLYESTDKKAYKQEIEVVARNAAIRDGLIDPEATTEAEQ